MTGRPGTRCSTISRASSAIEVDGEATGTECRITSLTVGSLSDAILGSQLFEQTELRRDCPRQITCDDSQRAVLSRYPLRRSATDKNGETRGIRSTESLRQKPANRSTQD